MPNLIFENTKITLVWHWTDSDNDVVEKQKMLNDITSKLTELEIRNLKDILDHQYDVGHLNEADTNNPDL